MTLLAALTLGVVPAGVARGDRMFYQGGLWLETSAEVQRLSWLRVFRSWRALAEEGEGGPLPHRQATFARLHRCLDGAHTTEELLQQITRYSFAHPERIYYSLSDFVGEAVRDLCPEMAPQTPRRPERRGEAGALLDPAIR